jgi:hypothetical protein
MWNKNKAKEIGILFEDGIIKKLDPWVGDALDVKKDSDEYTEIKQQFDADEQEDRPTIQQLFTIALVKTSNGISLHRVPSGSKLSFVNGDDHILIKEENQLSILELKTRKKATFLEKNDIYKSPVTVFNGASKQET